jgi:hypothetical protein
MPDMFSQYNIFRQENKSLIRKALDSSTGVGGALIPEHLEKVITNTLPRLRPELAMITSKYDPQKIHSFNRLTALPTADGAMGEGATTPTYNSTYARATVELKVIRRKGAVTNFLQDTSKTYIDAAAAEMENHLIAHVYDLTTHMLHGNAIANPYAFSGWDRFIATNRHNEAVGGAVPTDLTFLDTMIDDNMDRQGAAHRKVFLMSPQMLSKISRLLTNVRLNQGLVGAGLSTVDIPGGWRLAAYRDIPIIQTSQTRPKAKMTTVSIATNPAGSGGAIANSATNYFKVAAVTWDGETLASDEVTVATTGSSVSTITLSWTAYPGAFYYKIYYNASTTGAETLIKVIAAKNYDGTGTITTAVTSVVLTTVTADTNATTGSITTAMANDVPLVGTIATGDIPENVYFIDLDEFQGMGGLPYTNSAGSRFQGLVTIEPLAKTDDNIPFLVKTYCGLKDAFEATCSAWRGLKVK